MSSGIQKAAVTTRPMKIRAHPAIAASSIVEYPSLRSEEDASAERSIITAPTVNTKPMAMSRKPMTPRAMPARLLSLTSIGRSASSGVTRVAERADPIEASMVMTTPKTSGITKTCQVNTNPPVMPRLASAWLCTTIAMIAEPNAIPSAEAIKPRMAASPITDRYSWPFCAPMVRSSAKVRRRWATSTWKVLAMTSAATNIARMPKHMRNTVTALVPDWLSDLSASSPAFCRVSML